MGKFQDWLSDRLVGPPEFVREEDKIGEEIERLIDQAEIKQGRKLTEGEIDDICESFEPRLKALRRKYKVL